MGKKAKKQVPEAKPNRVETEIGTKPKAKKDKKKAKKRSVKRPLAEEERAAATEQFLANAVKNPELISGMPIVLVCAPDISKNDFDDEAEIEGDEEMGMAFLNMLMPMSTERSTLLWAQPISSYLPDEATTLDVLSILAFIQELRCRTGRNIVLTIEYSPEESFVSDRPILTTNCIRNQEFLNNLITPIGTFGFIELLTDTNSGKTYGRYYVSIPVATLVEMGAKSCSTALVGPRKLTAPWVAESKINYPPQRLDNYEPGTRAMKDAARFWSMFYRGEIMGPDCPEAELLQSMLTSDETPSVRLYKGSSGMQILDPDVFTGGKVQVLDDIELTDIELAAETPEKVLFGEDAIKWAQRQLDIALEKYYFSWHVREYAIDFPETVVVLRFVEKKIVPKTYRIAKKASL